MRRSNLLLSVITSLLFLVTAPQSQAVTYTGEPTLLGSFGLSGGPNANATFDNPNPADGVFTNTFQFELTSVALFEVASATNNVPLIAGFTIQLFQALSGGSATNVGPAIGTSSTNPVGPTSQLALQSQDNLAIGFYNLVISGNAPAAANYAGVLNLTFELIPEVPIPGAAWLFATGLLGVLALSRTRRKTQTPQA
jgi:hypothetical protein